MAFGVVLVVAERVGPLEQGKVGERFVDAG